MRYSKATIIITLAVDSIPYCRRWTQNAVSVVVVCTGDAYTLLIYHDHICAFASYWCLHSYTLWSIKLVTLLTFTTLIILKEVLSIALTRLSIPSWIRWTLSSKWRAALNRIIPYISWPTIFTVWTFLTIPCHIWGANST
jgi:hypothetical protein